MLTPDAVFRLHPKIRWAALSKEPSIVEFSQMRPDVESYTPNAVDEVFMEMGPLIMTSVAERLTAEGKAGKLECLIACFEKVCVLVVEVGNGHLALSIDKDQALTVFGEIIPQVLKFAS